MGNFMKKDVLLEEAERLGVLDQLEGLSWPQQQKLVIEAKSAAGEKLNQDMVGRKHKPKPQEPVLVKPSEIARDAGRVRRVEDYFGKTVVLGAEIAPTNIQLCKYDEDLGEEPMVADSNLKDDWDMGKPLAIETNKSYVTGTHYVAGKTGRRVMGQATLPKENAEITFRPERDLVPVVRFGNQRGYLFTHHRLPNIKALLKQCGCYEKYRERFSEPPAVFYLTGLLCCDISTTHYVFDEITRAERERRELKQQRGW